MVGNGMSQIDMGATLAAPLRWIRNIQLPTDTTGKQIRDLAMARNGGSAFVCQITIDGVVCTFTRQHTAIALDMPNQVDSFHTAIARVSSAVFPQIFS